MKNKPALNLSKEKNKTNDDTYKEYIVRKIELGKKSIKNGKAISSNDLRKEIKKW